MVAKLEAIKGGGGSVEVGTTGTISTLMSRELDAVSKQPSPSQTPLPSIKILEEPTLVPCQAQTPRKLRPARSSSGEASSSGSNPQNKKRPESSSRKIKPRNRRLSQLPILESDNTLLDATPSRGKTDKRGGGAYIVEVVDIKCGHPDRAWAIPITSRLKKLGFSKLSENTIV